MTAALRRAALFHYLRDSWFLTLLVLVASLPALPLLSKTR